jgi:hypothetical protein
MPASEVLHALKHVWAVLDSLRLPMAVMGGIALSAWKHPRATQDVDLLVSLTGTDENLLLPQLAAARIRPKRQPPILTIGQLRIVQLLYNPPGTYLDLQIDLLLADSEYQQEALARRTVLNLPETGTTVAVLSCDDLILHKILAGRILDRADATVLVRANRASLDLAYLRRWASALQLTEALNEIWHEALPDEPPPVSLQGA